MIAELTTLTVHHVVNHALLLAAAGPSPAPTSGVPGVTNVAPTPIPGLSGTIGTVLGWGKWLALVFGIIGLGMCGVMMMVGRRNRHSFAADGAAGIPWVLGGLALVAISGGIVGVFLS